jgi:hypothetical protein
MAAQIIHLLKAIEVCDDIDATDECLNYGYLEDRHPLIQDAARAIEALLIKDDGNRNYTAEIDLEEAGYRVFCLEKDGFGWLTGGVETEKGVIAYG